MILVFIQQDIVNIDFSSVEDPAAAYLKQVSFKFQLNELMEIKDTCVYSKKDQTHSAIIVKVNNSALQEHYGSSELLQVWGPQEKLVYQHILKGEVDLWNICKQRNDRNYFIYKLKEENAVITIVNLDKASQIIKITGLPSDQEYQYIQYDSTDNLLYFASRNEIKILSLNINEFKEGTSHLDAAHLHMRGIAPGPNLHGIILVDSEYWFAFETDDNQIDFNKLHVQNFCDDQNFKFNFYQKTEPIPRKNFIIDPIVKFAYYVSDSFFYGIALRQSARFDLYCDFQRKCSLENDIVRDVAMSADYFHYKTGNGVAFKLAHEDSQLLDLKKCQQINETDKNNSFEDFQRIKSLNVKNCGLFAGLQVLTIGATISAIVAHDQFLTFYDAIANEWGKPIFFPDGRISNFFQIENIMGQFDLGVVLKSSHLFIIAVNHNRELISASTWEQNGPFQVFQIEGEIKQVCSDIRNKKFALLTHKYDDRMKCSLLYKGNVFQIEDDINNFDSDANLVILQQKLDHTQPQMQFLVQKQITTLQVLNIVSKDIEIDDYVQSDDLFDQETEEQESDLEIDQEELNQSQDNEKYDKNLQRQIALKKQRHKEQNVQKPSIIKQNKYVFERNNNIEQNFHSAIMNEDGSFLFFFDQKSIYCYNAIKKSIHSIPDQNCQNIIHINSQVNYATCDNKKLEKSGLILYDLEDIITNINSQKDNNNNIQCRCIPMQNYNVKLNSCLVFNIEESRISYFNNYEFGTILPFLHTNAVKFIGLANPEDIVVHKISSGTFSALDRKGILMIWNLLNGRLKSQVNIGYTWLSNYVVHSPEVGTQINMENRQNKVLIRSKKEVTSSIKEDWRTNSNQSRQLLQNQITEQENMKRRIVRWKCIGITGQQSATVYFDFIHPSYEFQYLYIDSNNTYMIERLVTSTNLYVSQRHPKKENRIIWNLVKKISNQCDLEPANKRILNWYSPDFYYYLATTENQFSIKETITDMIVSIIPEYLMSFQKREDINSVINRFQWLDSSTFRIVNTEGIEYIVDFQENFKILASNKIQLFEQDKDEWSGSQVYFYERSLLDLNDTEQQLLRKSQEYKSQYYLFNKRDRYSLQKYMYTVDHRRIEYASLSFTFLHWRLALQIGNEEINLRDINKRHIQSMAYNIFPDGNTLFHLFSEKSQADDIQTLMEISQPDSQKPDYIEIYVPFLPNFEGRSPLHLSIERQDTKSINLILKYLSGFELDHHSKAISDLIPELIERNYTSMISYLQSRVQETEQLKAFDCTELTYDFDLLATGHIWFNDGELTRNVSSNYYSREGNYKAAFIDIPKFNLSHEGAIQLFYSLAGQESYDYYKLIPVQKIIDFNYPLVKKHTLKKLFIPYCFFLLNFILYNGYYYGFFGEQQGKKWLVILLQGPLLIYSLFFIYKEFRQLSQEGFIYFYSLINLMSFLAPIGLITVIIQQDLLTFSENSSIDQTTTHSVIKALTTFFLWMELFSFLKIFTSTSYYITMIFEVMKDMSAFLLILVITILTFGQTFQSLSMDNDEKDQFTSGFITSLIYSYTLILGNFDFNFGTIAPNLGMIFFILSTIFNMIIMLNLLIAIISDSYSRVQSDAVYAAYQDMAILIAENYYYVPPSELENQVEEGQQLIIFTKKEDEDQDYVEVINGKLEELNTKIETLISRMDQVFIQQ